MKYRKCQFSFVIVVSGHFLMYLLYLVYMWLGNKQFTTPVLYYLVFNFVNKGLKDNSNEYFFQFRLLLVPLALFSLQYTQIISFVMISPYYYYYISGSLSSLLLKKNRKKGSFLSLSAKKKEKSNLTLSFSPTFASWSIFIFKVEVLAS